MAAAALSRSRGVAGVRTTKGLFFIFTLLSLVCLASSLTDKDRLEKHKETIEKVQQQIDRLKATGATSSELISEYMSFMDPMMALLKKTSKLSPDFPPVEGFLENIKDFMEKTKTYVDEQNEELHAEIEESEQKLAKMKKLIKYLEEQQAEL